MAKSIELLFENAEGATVRIALDQPVEPFDAAVVSAAMDTILAQNALTSAGGDLVKKKGARIVERNVTEIEMA